jgi:hypothetical protein
MSVSDRHLLSTRLDAIVSTCSLVLFFALSVPPSADAVPMTNDPKGFNGIAWGTELDGRPELALVNTARKIKEYDFKDGPIELGDAKVNMMRLSTVGGKFARVTIRYRGKEVHAKVLAHLQEKYGPLDRTPGQTMRGFNQQYNWRGQDTEVNMTYEGQGERGFLFIESTLLAPLFNDTLPEHAY